jgi:hypothetical protein
MACLVCAVAGCGKKLAQVNGVTISMDQFHERLMKEHGQEAVGALIMEQLVLEEAQNHRLLPTDAEIKAWLADFKQTRGIQNDEQWIQALRAQGLDDADFLYQGKFEMALFKLQTAHLHPTEAQLQAFFKEHQQNFNTPAMIRFRQIVVDTPEKIDKVRAKLAQGFDFGALAKQYSLDPQAKETGGDVGMLLPIEALPVPQEQGGVGMPPELFKVVQELPVEKASDPVPLTFKDPSGKEVHRTYFFLVTERQAKKVVAYKEIKDRVRQAYLQTHAKPREEIFHQLAQKADVVIYEDRYRAYESQFGGQTPQPNIPTPGAPETPGGGPAAGGTATPTPPTTPGTPTPGGTGGTGGTTPTAPTPSEGQAPGGGAR